MVKLKPDEITKMRISRIEKEIRDTPYHKGTEHHIGRLRAKLSKLKEEQDSSSTKKGGGSGGYAVKKQGEATITLVGPPSAGKSTLLNKLTNANSKIAPYEFTTLSVVPGMMTHKDAEIQILDVPGLIEGAEIGKGRGREVLSVVRGSDILIIMCDVKRVKRFGTIIEALEKSGIRINKTPPDVAIKKGVRGGLIINSNIKQDLDRETIAQVSNEFRIVNGEITIKEKLTMDTLIDAFSPNRVYIPTIFVVNKVDLEKGSKMSRNLDQNKGLTLAISAEKNINLDKLKDAIWKKLNFVRVYLVRSDEKPSFDNPLIMKSGDTLCDVAKKIGKEFAEEKTRAKIWEAGAKFPEQEVSIKTKVVEGMQVRFV